MVVAAGVRFEGREGAIFGGVVLVLVVVVLRLGCLWSGAAVLDGVVGVGAAAGCCCCCRWRRWRCFLRRRRCLDRDSPSAEVEVAAADEEAVKAGAPATLEVVAVVGLREEKDEGEGDAVDDPASLTNRFGGA